MQTRTVRAMRRRRPIDDEMHILDTRSSCVRTSIYCSDRTSTESRL